MTRLHPFTKHLAALGIVADARFVPWSQSRNRNEKDFSLNWLITIRIGDRTIITTDYMQGIAHAPSYKPGPMTGHREAILKIEIERGCRAGIHGFADRTRPLTPPSVSDVMYSLLSDAGALDYTGFEDWAPEYGYDPDSRRAEAIYRACLDIALRLRSGLGEPLFSQLQELAQDY